MVLIVFDDFYSVLNSMNSRTTSKHLCTYVNYKIFTLYEIIHNMYLYYNIIINIYVVVRICDYKFKKTETKEK